MKIFINCLHYKSTQRVGTLVWLNNVLKILSQSHEVIVVQRQDVETLFDFVPHKKLKVVSPVWAITKFAVVNIDKSELILTPHLGGPLLPSYKTLMVIHDLAWNDNVDKYRRLRRLKLIISTYFFARMTSHVWTVSEFSKYRIRDLYGIEANVITNLVSVDSVDPSKYTLPYQDYFLSIGTVQPGKNYERLKVVFERELPNENLLIIGKNELGLKDGKNVKFLDYVDNETMIQYLDNANGYINVSYYEGFGIPVVDAMTRKIPILISLGSAFDFFRTTEIIRCDPYSPRSISTALSLLIGQKGKIVDYSDDLSRCSIEVLKNQLAHAISKI